MKNKPLVKSGKRTAPRNPTETAITCRPFTSGATQASDGIMRNFSSGGSYIETSGNFRPGTILVVRMTLGPSLPSSLAAEEGLRSICLAEVKWMQELDEERAVRYGMGIRYLE